MADRSIASTQAIRKLLKQLNLHMNEPGPVIICRICHFTLSGSITKDLAKGKGQFSQPSTILRPKELHLRPDYTPLHPHLSKHLGMMCKHCQQKTTSAEILARHLSKEHGVKRKTATWLREHGVRGLMLQIWDRNGAYEYWIVEAERSASANSTFDNSQLQESAPRIQRFEQNHRDERERLISIQKVANDMGSCDMALNTN
jgi:hypothetical protein